VGAALFCFYLPNRFFSPQSPIFRAFSWEKEGRIYEKYLRVSRWKQILPDGSIVAKSRGFRKKKLQSFTFEYLERFMVESCRAEMTHLLAILPFWVFWFFTPPYVPWMMLVYALIVNIPCIIVQRYNRPRIMRILQKRESMSVTREDR
jgi:glycosyl-4,4'-diaponeurosporenoate acyltransferase